MNGKGRKHIDRDLLFNQYVVLGKTSRETAKFLGVSGATVLKYLREYGMCVRDNFTHNIDKDWLTLEYCINKRSVGELSLELGCDKTTIHNNLRKFGIAVRSSSYNVLGESLSKLDDYGWMYEQYVILRKSSIHISQEIGCSDTTVRNFLRKHNISRRNNSESSLGNSLEKLSNPDWIGNEYVSGQRTTQDIAIELGCDKKTVSTYLKKHNIELRGNSYRSSYEHKIANFLSKHGIAFITSDRELIAPLELDIYIPSCRIAIEVNGLYWHSELYKDMRYHENKRILCESVGVRLINLYEDDLSYRFDIVERFLLNALNKNKEYRVFARKCTINRTPKKNICREFMDAYHIQGYAANNNALSLEYCGDTVAIMLFNGNVLTRYATSCKVVGGFGKLLAACDINNIITFVDLDTFTGESYFKVGFSIDKYIKPDYKYVVGNRRIHKFNYRLKKFRDDDNLLYVEGATERELAVMNKLYRIYDSGKYRLVLYK